MTAHDIIRLADRPVVVFAGDELRAFCDLFEGAQQQGDWPAIRRAAYIRGVRYLPPANIRDEDSQLFIGRALNRDWYVPIDTLKGRCACDWCRTIAAREAIRYLPAKGIQ